MDKRLVIFDLDDTLIHSHAKIKMYCSITNTIITEMSPAQFNYHVRNEDTYFSFEDFDSEEILYQSNFFPNTLRSFKRYMELGVPLSIITARNKKWMIVDFFKKHGMWLNPHHVFAVHDDEYNSLRYGKPFSGNIAQRKKQAIQLLIHEGYNQITFYDDNVDNLNAAMELNSPDVKIKITHVLHEQTKETRPSVRCSTRKTGSTRKNGFQSHQIHRQPIGVL